MTPEDTNRIVAAIDRNTKMLWTLDQTLWLVFCCLLFIGMMTCSAGAAKASPITHAPITEQSLQYWHTQWVPTDGGVYSREVYAPALPKVEPEPYVFVDIGDPPRLETPEPGTGILVAGVVFLLIAGSYTAHLLDKAENRELNLKLALTDIKHSTNILQSRETARKALEGSK